MGGAEAERLGGEVGMVVNGREVSIPSGYETAIDALRLGLGLTGTKLVCGTGVCGACTVSVDGVPVASCVLPAEDLEDRSVVTIEGVGSEGELHPVQAAFLHHDALQCGYCTPGFVVEAVAFFDRWRESSGTSRPSREEIARALAGHLCRCGAYQGIYRAVSDACAGLFDESDAPTTRAEPSTPRPDGRAKVTGAARYTADVHLDALVGRIVRSPEPHAELLGLDSSPALDLGGVEAYVPLAEPGDRIRYRGQPLAAVAAIDEETARRAADHVEVDLRVLPSAVGATDSLAEGAPDVHGWWIPPSNNEGPATPNLRRRNLVGPSLPGSANPWRVSRRLSRDARKVRGRWSTSVHSHTAFEPHAAVAAWQPDGRLVVHLSTQGVSRARAQLVAELSIDENEVEVITEYVGGAFGAKQSLGDEPVVAARLSRIAGRPVRVVLDRVEEMTVGGNRPGTAVDVALSASGAGELRAMRVRSVADSGASAGSLVASFLPRLVYPGAPRTLLDFDAVSNTPPGTPFRAPGGPPALFALEAAIDDLARELAVDPISLRRSWNDRPLRDAMYDWVEAQPRWREERTPAMGRMRRGVGAAFGSWFNAHDPGVEVTVTAGPHGFRVSAPAQDMGNGTRAVLASAVSDAFGLEPAGVDVHLGGSGPGPLSAGSRTTASLWPAAHRAAVAARDRLLEQACTLVGEGVEASAGGVVHAGEWLSWDELLPRLEPVIETRGRPPDSRRLAPFPLRFGGLQFGHTLTESAHLAEVEVDLSLGTVRVLSLDTAIAAGRIHVPALARSQVFGGVVQGLGMALYEERVVDPRTGAVLTSNLEDYHLVGIGDAPEMSVDFIEWGFEHIPGGGVGLAELALVAVPAAVAAAVRAATGTRPRRLPIGPAHLIGGGS